MKVRALIFDINGTLIDINTDEGMEEIYRAIGHVLTYQGISLRRFEVRDLYFRIMDEQRRASNEEYPEFDAVAIWREIIERYASGYTRSLPPEEIEQTPRFLAKLHRGISRRRLQLYPDVKDMLDQLRPRYRLAAVTDAQSPYALPELHAVGLLDYFDPVIVSGDYGYRKPDARLFRHALEELHVNAEEVLYVGNDIYRDVFGAQQLGIKTVFFIASNQGERYKPGIQADYLIYNFPELSQAIKHFEEGEQT